MKSILRLFLVLFFITATCNLVHGQTTDARVSWDRSPSATNNPPLAIGTFIYVWTGDATLSNVGTNFQVYDGMQGTNMILYGLIPGVTYYFTGTAYDAYDDESDFCNEISYTPQIGIDTNTINIGYVTNVVTLNVPVMVADQVYMNFTMVWTNPPEAAKFFRSGPLTVDSSQDIPIVNLPVSYLTNLMDTNWVQETNFSVVFPGDTNQLSAGNLVITEQSFAPMLNYLYQNNGDKADSSNMFFGMTKVEMPPLMPSREIEMKPEQQLYIVTEPKKPANISIPPVVPTVPKKVQPLLSPKMKNQPLNKPMKRAKKPVAFVKPKESSVSISPY